ncbi:MAG: glycosyltransferase family 4 protein [Elusimicrobia bacterium]|nr:glycosyltransferase family 4 protein [Elusimicrobiota bacterium]
MRILLYDWALHFLGGGQKYACDIAAALQDGHTVTLLGSKPVKKEFLEASYGLDLSRVELPGFDFSPAVEELPSGLYSVLLRQWNYAREAAKVSSLTRDYDLFINCEASRSMIRPLSPKSILVCHFPPRSDLRKEWDAYGTALKYTYALPYRVLAGLFPPKNHAADYGMVLTCSQFSKGWIKRLWGVPARVLYPSVRPGAGGHAGNSILTVARIARKKKILEMIDVFRGLHERGLSGWDFIIAGSAAPDRQQYLQKIRGAMAGLPVRLVINPSFEELSGLYASSRIYWHMAGLGVDAEAEPYEMEHFGITPVEAMSHGVVPILYNGGGMREIVEENESGFLVDGLGRLAARTSELCGSPALLERMSKGALARSAFFSREAFGSGIRSAIEEL